MQCKILYRIGLCGNDPMVLDGTWRNLFDDAAEDPTEGNDGPPVSIMEQDDTTREREVRRANSPPMQLTRPNQVKAKAGQKRKAARLAGWHRERRHEL
ncbi:hypothetical protein K432DRAFT_381926 [Lepidopterella palustris CBS 459.81]|uniref:Uncharacterized protein n=1 Tax=Lepidopterella palustris CBS 459.81 TaxID=1314670 RepID=A0A8E2EBJ7_9PEZI|nr:hypothetical protein K432DRAFT_381926 [Lepidopterella palustris CBS 459.81]